MESKDFKCVYDPILAGAKKGKAPAYVKIKRGVAKAEDPRLKAPHPAPRTRRRAPGGSLPVPALVVDANWIGPQPQTHVLLYNLSTLTTAGQISTELAPIGKLDECQLVMHPDTAASLGICRIRFAGELGVANKLAQKLLAAPPRIGRDVPSAEFDDDMARQNELVRRLVDARNLELERLRRQEREKRAREERERRRDRDRDRDGDGDGRDRAAQTDRPRESYDQWLDKAIGPYDYLIVKNHLPNSGAARQDLTDTLRICSPKSVLYHPARGFHVTFDSSARAARCYEQLNHTRMSRSGKFLHFDLRRSRPQSDPAGEALKQIMAELRQRLVEDIRRRVVLPTIFAALQPERYAGLDRQLASPAPAPTIGQSPLVGEQNGQVDLKKLHFKKRVDSRASVAPIKRRKLMMDELESEGPSDSGDESMEDLQSSFDRKIAEMAEPDVPLPESPPSEPKHEDVEMPDAAIASLPDRVVARRPVPLFPLTQKTVLLSDLQSLVLDDEDWQCLRAAVGPGPPAATWEKAVVWSSLHRDKEALFAAQKQPLGEIPVDMLVPQWEAPAPPAWRLRGYEPIPSVLKSSYLPHRRRVRDPIDSVQRDSPHEAAVHKSTDRHSRMASRRLAQNLNSQKQALSVETSILDMNQLLKRRKPVKFARSAIHNWGLYAVDKIDKNEMIIEYVGEVIRAPLADLRERNYVRSGIGSSYLFRIDGQTVIDATKRGGIARFINHSCEPSCMAKIIKVEGTKRIVIYALRDIHANEELTYDYKFEREQGVDRITCLCGATNCKGYLN